MKTSPENFEYEFKVEENTNMIYKNISARYYDFYAVYIKCLDVGFSCIFCLDWNQDPIGSCWNLS